MRVVTLNGTFEIDLSKMKVLDMRTKLEHDLMVVPSPVIGSRMEIITEDGTATTEPVVEVTS
jgi:hypothetical protein